jgi:hypothetical protein
MHSDGTEQKPDSKYADYFEREIARFKVVRRYEIALAEKLRN